MHEKTKRGVRYRESRESAASKLLLCFKPQKVHNSINMKNSTLDQHGFVAILMLLILLVLAGVAFAFWRVRQLG